MHKQLLKGTVVFAFAAAISSFFNFIFYTLGRVIGPDQFGLLVSLMSLLMIVSVAQEILSQVIAKIASENDFEVKTFVYKIGKPLLFIQVGISVVIFLSGAFFLKDYLGTQSLIPFVIIAMFPLVGFLLAIHRGILTGKKRFHYTAATQVIEAVIKVVLAFLFVGLGFSVNAILLALLIASFVAYLLATYFSAKIKGLGSVDLSILLKPKMVMALAVNLLILNIFISIDSIVARNQLMGFDAGIYAGVITFGKLLYFLANSVTLALFPISTSKASGKQLLFNGFGITILLGTLTSIGFLIFGEFAVSIIFGKEFLRVAQYLVIEAMIITIFAVVAQLSAFLMAKNSFKFNYIYLIGVIVQIVLLMSFGDSVSNILKVQAVIGGGLLIAGISYLYTYGYQK